jgi:trans-aconitate methyltransferase
MTDRAMWNPDEYASATAHHRAYDDAVLDPITITPDARILDLGSGVGDLTRRLAGIASAGNVLGLDRSPALVDSARHAHRDVSNVAFTVCSAEDLIDLEPVTLPNGDRTGPPFDLVISTATLHWVPQSRHRAVYDGVFGVLRPGGAFRAEFGGSGQIAPVRAVLDLISTELDGPVSPWYFPTPDEVEKPVREAGFTLDGGFCRLVEQVKSARVVYEPVTNSR